MSQKSFATKSIDSCMNLLISKVDQIDNSSEAESLLFELHSLKNKNFKTKIADQKENNPLIPSSMQNKDQIESSNVPVKLRK